jgi:hypothetical protein
MTRKSQPAYGDEVLQRAADVPGDASEHSLPSGEPRSESGDRASQRHERRRRPGAAVNRTVSSGSAPVSFDPSSSREALIATAAYYRAANRGFLPGYELEDWLAAEREIDGVGTEPI